MRSNSEDEWGHEGLGIVVDTASTLDDIDTSLHEALGDPAKRIGLGVVISIVESNDFALGLESEEVIDVVGLGSGLGDLEDAEAGTLLGEIAKFCLDGLDGAREVVANVDGHSVRGVVELSKSISGLTHDDILFIGEVGGENDIDQRPPLTLVELEAVDLGMTPCLTCVDGRSNTLHGFGRHRKRSERL